jgi:hypothetical protein
MKNTIPINKRHLFTCKRCDSHDVLVASLYKVIEVHKKILPCECHTALDSMAAIESFTVEKHLEDYGYLDQNHQWEFVSRNNLIDRKELDTDMQLQCGKCFIIYEIDKKKWKTKFRKRELLEESVKFHVSCGGCGHEIEFGWSEPNRAGHIWPVECIDFNPTKVWPEPRFREKWSQKGWLRSEHLIDTFFFERKISTLLKKLDDKIKQE